MGRRIKLEALIPGRDGGARDGLLFLWGQVMVSPLVFLVGVVVVFGNLDWVVCV